MTTLCTKIFAVATAVAAAFAPLSARTAQDAFTSAPTSVLPLLQPNDRLDMLDYYNSGLPSGTTNVLQGSSRIAAMDSTSISVTITRDATVQIALVPLKNDTIIAVIETVKTPVEDSNISLYTTDWQPLAKQPSMPRTADFLPKGTKPGKNVEMPDVLFVAAEYLPAKGVFVFRNTTPAYYTEDGQPAGLKLMHSTIERTFDGKKLVAPKP